MADHPTHVFELTGGRFSVRNWATRHLQTFVATWGDMVRKPSSTLLTIAVIGISMALPAGLYVLLDNVGQVTQSWEGAAELSVFFKEDATPSDAEAVGKKLLGRGEVRRFTIITKEQALAQFKEWSGFAEVLESSRLENPLPVVLVVTLNPDSVATTAVSALLEELRRRPDVELAQFDLDWVNRLRGILSVIQRVVAILAVSLAAAVVLIVGNTLRAVVDSRRQEIIVSKLVGRHPRLCAKTVSS